MSISEQNAAIMATPVVLVNDSNAITRAAASQLCDECLSILMIDNDIYNKQIKRNSLHIPCEKMMVPGSSAIANEITELTIRFPVLIYNQVQIAIKPDNRKLMDMCEASSSAVELTPSRPIRTGDIGGKWLILRINSSRLSICVCHGE